jgi:hypothetical protein
MPVQVGTTSVRTVATGATLTTPTRQPANTPTTDLGRCKSVTTSSASASYPAIAAIDGTGATSWRPTASGATLTIDLGTPKTVSRIDVTSVSSTTPYTIQVSSNGTSWTTVATQATATTTSTSHTLATPMVARYVRYAAGSTAKAKLATIIVT